MNHIEAMKQALEALEHNVGEYRVEGAANILRTAIEQAEKQEPVAWQVHPFDYGIGHEDVYARTDRPEQVEMWKRKGWTVQPIYTTPPAAPVQEEIQRMAALVRAQQITIEKLEAQRQWVDMPELELLGAYEEEQQGRWGDHVRGLLNVQAKLREKNGGQA